MNVQTLTVILNLDDEKFQDFSFEDVILKQARITYDNKKFVCFKSTKDAFGTFLMYSVINSNIGVSNLDLFVEYPEEDLVIFTLLEEQVNTILSDNEDEDFGVEQILNNKEIEKVDMKIVETSNTPQEKPKGKRGRPKGKKGIPNKNATADNSVEHKKVEIVKSVEPTIKLIECPVEMKSKKKSKNQGKEYIQYMFDFSNVM